MSFIYHSNNSKHSKAFYSLYKNYNSTTVKLFLLGLVYIFSCGFSDDECRTIFNHSNKSLIDSQDDDTEEEDPKYKETLKKYSPSTKTGVSRLKHSHKAMLDQFKKTSELLTKKSSSFSSYGQAASVYVALNLIGYFLFRDAVTQEFVSYIEANATSGIDFLHDEVLYELLGVNKKTDFKEKIQSLVSKFKLATTINYPVILSATFSSIQQQLQILSELSLDDPDIVSKLDKITSEYSHSKEALITLYVFMYLDKFLNLSNLKLFGIEKIFWHLNIFKFVFKSTILRSQYEITDKTLKLSSNFSPKNFEQLLYIFISHPQHMIASVNNDNNSDLAKDQNIIFIFTLEKTIDHINSFLEDSLKIPTNLPTVEDIFKLVRPHVRDLFHSIIENIIKFRKFKPIDTHEIYSDDMIALIASIHYWLYTFTSNYKGLSENPDNSELLTMVKDIMRSYIDCVYQLYKNMDEFNQMIFTWYLGYVLHIYNVGFDDKRTAAIHGLNLGLIEKLFPDVLTSKDPLTSMKRTLVLINTCKDLILNFIYDYPNDPKPDKNIYLYTLHTVFTDSIYKKIILSIRLRLTNDLISIDELFEYFNNNFSDSEIFNNFVYIVAKSTTSQSELKTVFKNLTSLKYDTDELMRIYFSNVDQESVFAGSDSEFNSNLTTDSDSKETFNNKDSSLDNSLSEKLLSLSKLPINAKKLLARFLLSKKEIRLDEINFLIRSQKKFQLDLTEISKKILSISLKDTIQLIKQKVHADSRELEFSILARLLSTSLEDINSCTDDELMVMINFLIYYTKQSDVEAKILLVLQSRNKLQEELINKCSGDSFLSTNLSLTKEFLIKHGFIKKTPKIKRQVIKKIPTSSVDQNILLASDVELLILDMEDTQDLGSALNLVQIFNKLVDEYEKHDGFSGGKKESKELQKSLNLILKMIQNFSIEEYPLLKQVFYSNLEEKSLFFLTSNTSSYKLKDKIYSILMYWLDSNKISPTNTDFGVQIINNLFNLKTLSSVQIYNLCIKIMKKPYLNLEGTRVIIPVLASIIKNDLKLIGLSKNDPHFNLFTFDHITKDLIPIISKYKNEAEDLRMILKSRLEPVYHNNLGIDQTGIISLKIVKQLLEHINNFPLYQRIILLSILPDEAYLYIRNFKNSLDNKVLAELVRSCSLNLNYSKDPAYIIELSSSNIERLDHTPILQSIIKYSISKISTQSFSEFILENSVNMREKTSIQIVLLDEICKGNLPLDLSSKNFIGLGFDIISMGSSSINYIEVKSKMDLFSGEFPPNLSLNEVKVALEFHTNQRSGNYLLYLVPLNKDKIYTYGHIINMNINWEKLDTLFQKYKSKGSDNSTQERNSLKGVKILLKDFTTNLFK